MAGGGQGGPKSDINITPFTDVVLVLLIVFMIATPSVVQSSIKVHLPMGGSTDDKVLSETVMVYINEKGDVMIDDKEFNTGRGIDKLRSRLNEIASKSKETTIVINGNPEVQYEYVVRFIDAARGLGLNKIVLGVDIRR